ncbi:MAG TPA: sulfatase [Vicinamibacterales bacterium]|nr:sulfatase [Vicinamibacterales bacterium]
MSDRGGNLGAREASIGALKGSDALWILLAIGTAAGVLTSVGLGLATIRLGHFVPQGVNLAWTGPVGTTFLVLVWGALLWMAGTVAPALRRLPNFVAAAVWLPSTGLLLNLNGIHPVAAAVCAGGVAAVAMRIAQRAPKMSLQLGRRLAFGGMLATAVAFITVVVAMPMFEDWKTGRVPPPPATAPNVLLIVLDTVRAKSLGSYGSTRGTSPFFDELAKSGVRFEHAFSTAPWTTPSHASIMTGLWPSELALGWKRTLDDQKPTVAKVLSDAGYATGGFSANMGNAGVSSGIARGFTHFEDYPMSAWSVLRGSKIGVEITGSIWLRELLGHHSSPDRKRSPQVSTEFLSWLDDQQERPFFAFLNYFDAHNPYEAPPAFEERFGVSRTPRPNDVSPLDWMDWNDAQKDVALRTYEAAIAYQDEQLRGLFAELEKRGKLANTLVIVTSDHGEEFGEHGVMRHGNSLYRASVHVPLVVSFPNHVNAGRVISTPVSLRSIAASLSQVVPGLAPGLFRGPSLFDIIEDEASAEPVLSTLDGVRSQPEGFPVHDGPLYAVVHKGYRYIVNVEGAEELYRLDDEDERTNLAASPDEQGIMTEMRAALAKMPGIEGGG